MKKAKASALIDIGSSHLKLYIAQQAPRAKNSHEKGAEHVQYLEHLSRPIGFGRETFHAAKLSFERIDQAAAIIKNYVSVARGYGIRSLGAVASTALREAENEAYVIDQIKIKTGVQVSVIDDLEEKNHIYKLLAHYTEDRMKESAIIVYIGTGSMGVCLFSAGRPQRVWNIRVGSLRMGELFGEIQEFTRDFYKLMDEYLAGFTYSLRDSLPPDVCHFIVTGPDTPVIARLAGVDPPPANPVFEVPRHAFVCMYDEIKQKTTGQIAADYAIDVEQAESLLPAACMWHNLLGYTHADVITASTLLPCDGILFEMLHPKRISAISKRFDKGALESARELSLRHGISPTHGDIVRSFVNLIFARLKKLHGLAGRDLLLLSVAAYLHDIGKSVHPIDHHITSYEMVRHADIVGLTQHEQEIVALICCYHSEDGPNMPESERMIFESATRVRTMKLTAMLRLADSLDRSSTQKYSDIDVRLVDNTLVVTANTDKNISLEQWSFERKGKFFAEIFGIMPKLVIKKTNLR